MCFSAPASFIASGGLAAVGGASLAVGKKEDRILAAIPLMFSIQQAIEGVQWLYLNQGCSSLFAGYSFLFFALIVWPIYVPIFVYVLDKERRYILKWFFFLGVLVALYYVLQLVTTHSLLVSQVSRSVSYSFESPFGGLVFIGYFLATFGSLFVSSKLVFKWFSGIIAVLALISWYFYAATFTSVWCFFAAIVSIMFFFYILYKKYRKSPLHRNVEA